MTLCVAECCGVSAYGFSPIHVAGFPLLYRGAPDPGETAKIREQLVTLKVNYGSEGRSACGVTLEQMNQGFSGEEIDQLVDTISRNLDIALELIEHVARSSTKSMTASPKDG